jgi:cytoskeletal protein CcmA (bactofilin family)
MSMWKRGDAVRPPDSGREVTGPAAPVPPPVVPPAPRVQAPETEAKRHMEKDVLIVGKSVVFKGELSGHEDLFIEGSVEGKIELRDNVLTIGPNAKIKAEVFAKVVIVRGEVAGNITASEKLDIRDSGSVDGDISAPVMAIAEGAHLRGSVDMQKKPAASAPPASSAPAPKPEAKLAPLPPGPSGPGAPRVQGT